jgi:ABC-type uncharacterized transport system substrate-binding protein
MPSPGLGLVMKRREFITLVGGAAAAWPLAANAQQKGKLHLIGVLNPGSTDTPGTVGFYDGLRELGYAEGLNIAIERRYGDWNTDRFQQLADDLVRLKVDVIVVISTSPARAAKQATSIIPIIVGGMADPVGDELIVSLSRPGGNITGTTFLGPELIAKRFGLLKEAISGLARRGALASCCIRETDNGRYVAGDRNCGAVIRIAAPPSAGRWSGRP